MGKNCTQMFKNVNSKPYILAITNTLKIPNTGDMKYMQHKIIPTLS